MNIYTKSPYLETYLSFIKTQQQFIVNNFIINGDSCYLLNVGSRQTKYRSILSHLNQHAN